MNVVAVERIGQDFVVQWDHLIVGFSKIKEHSEGYSAYLTISGFNLPGHGNGEIFEGRLQLQGTRSKADVVRECDKRFPDLDWTAIITRSCREVMKALEEGEPMVDLGEGEVTVASRRPIIDPLIYHGENVLLYGMGGTGKSTLALAAALCISEGLAHIGMAVPEAQNVLILDWESEEDEQRTRLAELCEGFGLEKRAHVSGQQAPDTGNEPRNGMEGRSVQLGGL